MVAHLEHLLYYGCDLNCRIVGSGNTPLHVAAINDQLDCARVLLLRGCDAQIVNNSHQNAYQVAVIAGNMQLAELISSFKPEMVQPYRERPKYNPQRKSFDYQHHHQQLQQQHNFNNECQGSHQHGLHPPDQSSPSLSHRSCATSSTTTTNTSSSGVCCDHDGSQSDGGDEESESDEESSVRQANLTPG